MAYWVLRDDFDAAARRHEHLDAALDDAWADFATFNGSMEQFFVARKKTHPHRYKVEAVDTTAAPELYNVDAQVRHARANGEDATRVLLASHGLKLGQVLKAKSEGNNLTESTNPFSDRFKGTAAEKSAAIGRLLTSKGGSKLVRDLAAAGGKTIDGLPLRPVGQRR
jgi:hypothetical protein